MAGAILAVVALAFAMLVCAFHDGVIHHHNVMTPDDPLCLGLVVVSLAVIVLARPLVVGWAVVLPRAPAYATTIHIPDPPPKTLSLA